MSTAIYRGETALHADTCEPLKRAADDGSIELKGWHHGNYPGREMPAGMLPGLSSVGLWDARVSQPWGLNWHYNEGVELTYVLRGKVPFSVNGSTHLLRPGQMTITRPWQRHRVGNPHIPPSALIWVILDVGVRRPNQNWKWPGWLLFSESDTRKLTQLLRQNEQSYWDADRRIRERFRLLAETLRYDDPDQSATRIAVSINDLLLELLDHFTNRGISQDPSLCSGRRTAALFLERLRSDSVNPWTLASMAQACGLSRTQFSRYCREIVNVTPLEFLRLCRVDVARKELSTRPDSSILDVAFRCGFNSSQYFATVFRAVTGETPTEYRRNGRVESATVSVAGEPDRTGWPTV